MFLWTSLATFILESCYNIWVVDLLFMTLKHLIVQFYSLTICIILIFIFLLFLQKWDRWVLDIDLLANSWKSCMFTTKFFYWLLTRGSFTSSHCLNWNNISMYVIIAADIYNLNSHYKYQLNIRCVHYPVTNIPRTLSIPHKKRFVKKSFLISSVEFLER